MKPKRADRLDGYLGNRLRQLRIRKGMSLARCGEMIDVTAQQISRYESGQQRISATTLYHLARGLDMPVSWFFDDFGRSPTPFQADAPAVLDAHAELGAISKSTPSWQPGSEPDRAQTLLSLWRALPKDAQRTQVIRLLEVFV